MASVRSVQPRTLALIVATALLMENIDASVLTTALPQIARDLNSDPLHLKLVLTSYLLALAIFIPASGWAADRCGARRIFRLAIVVFALGSIACGASTSLVELVFARVLQGIGGSMMTPVGRLIVLRSVSKADLVSAMAWLTIPALLGPVLGPPLGGLITTYLDWRWIFWINIPISVLGVYLASVYVPDIKAKDIRPFDFRGFILLGPGLAMTLTGITLAGLNLVAPIVALATIVSGMVLLGGYWWHARTAPDPLVDLSLLALPTFRLSLIGGSIFRVGTGALPFVLPLMFQLGFGWSAFQSGMLTFASGAGALLMKFLVERILKKFGFRQVLVANAVIAGLLALVPITFSPASPWLWMVALLFISGISRSLQFTAVNAIAYADVPGSRLGSATSFSVVIRQIASSVGITIAALVLEAVRGTSAGPMLQPSHYAAVFVMVALLSMVSALIFARLAADAGDALVPGRNRRDQSEP